MSRIHPECPASDLDRSVTADVLVRQEPDEEDDGDDGKEDDDDGDKDDDEGYSE